MPEPVIIANRPFWARISAVFWVIEIAVGLSFAAGGAGYTGSGENGAALVLVICSLLLAGPAPCWCSTAAPNSLQIDVLAPGREALDIY